MNTGFGKFSETRINTEQLAELQKRLVFSHAAGTGKQLAPEIVRLVLLFKVKSLSLGYSGCRFEIIQHLVDLLNHNIIPVIPEKGSVGASGDLAPLAHMTLVLMGEGEGMFLLGAGDATDSSVHGLWVNKGWDMIYNLLGIFVGMIAFFVRSRY